MQRRGFLATMVGGLTGWLGLGSLRASDPAVTSLVIPQPVIEYRGFRVYVDKVVNRDEIIRLTKARADAELGKVCGNEERFVPLSYSLDDVRVYPGYHGDTTHAEYRMIVKVLPIPQRTGSEWRLSEKVEWRGEAQA